MTDTAPTAPQVADLVHRLAECPDDFLASPLIGGSGTVSVAAVVGDTLQVLGAELPDGWTASLLPARADTTAENWLRACLVTCWLASDESLVTLVTGAQLLRFLGDELHRMANLVRADQIVQDPDRREELGRLFLRTAGIVPAGETIQQAVDRLATLDSVSRARVEAEARAAEERAREVRAALERKRAQEAAARASRE